MQNCNSHEWIFYFQAFQGAPSDILQQAGEMGLLGDDLVTGDEIVLQPVVVDEQDSPVEQSFQINHPFQVDQPIPADQSIPIDQPNSIDQSSPVESIPRTTLTFEDLDDLTSHNAPAFDQSSGSGVVELTPLLASVDVDPTGGFGDDMSNFINAILPGTDNVSLLEDNSRQEDNFFSLTNL